MKPYLHTGLVIAIFALGLGIRLYDLTDQLLDFHPTRQLRAAVIARGMYYQMLPDADPYLRDQAVAFWQFAGQYEPSMLENIVARTYLAMGGETLWVSRIYTALFWLIGGLAVLALGRRVAGLGGGMVALAYYLILPFGVQASRSFQPDPGMVMWILLAAWALYRWGDSPSWKWTILAGIFGGVGVLTKAVAGYMIGGAAVAVVLSIAGFKRFWRNLQVWGMAALFLLPSLVYYLGRSGRAADYFANWTVKLLHLLVQPTFYLRWLDMIQDLVGLTALLLAVVGVLIAAPRQRIFLLGLWGGYLAYGFFLPYQMYTHTYYHLVLIPIVALSLAPLAQLALQQVATQGKFWQLLFAGVVVVGVSFASWMSISLQKKVDYRSEPVRWQAIASQLPTDGKIIALTQDYGYRLAYYGWRKVALWPDRSELNLSSLRGDPKEFETLFLKKTEDKRYFLITVFETDFDQPELEQLLNSRYLLVAQGDGFLLFDLEHPKP